MKAQQDIQQVISRLALSEVHIDMRGCERAVFAAESEALLTPGPRRYRIYYPTLGEGYSANYLAPMAHELAHISQFQNGGSRADLLSRYSIKRIELGADFLAGVILGQFHDNSDLTRFQSDIHLVGRYNESANAAHGKPEEREKAFRRGYYFNIEQFDGDLARVHREFQRNVYGQVVEP